MPTLKPISNEDLRKRMKEGPVTFQFTKKDGSTRQAVGTLRSDLIAKKPAGGVCHPKELGYNLYWDLEKDGFRVYDPYKLLGVLEA